MRGLAIIFLSAAALVVVKANPCQNNEDVYFPDPEGETQTDLKNKTTFPQIVVVSTCASMALWWDT